MKRIGIGLIMLALSVAPGLAQSKGCVKGAVVGGVAGHVAGHHGAVGAAAGCAIGHHEATKKARAAERSAPTPQTQTHAAGQGTPAASEPTTSTPPTQ